MDLEGAVAIGEEEAAVIEEGDVRRQETLARPGCGRRDILTGRVAARLHRGLAVPHRLAVEGQLGERLHLLIAADIEELPLPLFPNLDAVAPSLELAAEGADERPGGVEDEDGRMVLLLLPPLVNDVQIPRAIDGDIVGRLPGVAVGELREVMLDAEGVLPGADDRLLPRLADAGQGRGGRGGGSAERQRPGESPAGEARRLG